MTPKRLVFRVHAIRRMFRRGISTADIRVVLETGEAIEDYPADSPYPSRLVLGFVRTRPVHVVAAENPVTGETIVVTTYEPDPSRWESDFRARKAT